MSRRVPRFPAVIEQVVIDPKTGEIISREGSRTKQAHKADCDINRIVKRAMNAGLHFSQLATSTGMYGDFASLPDFQAAQDLLVKASTQFSNLPAEVRKRFSNDPAEFLSFVSDKANHSEMVKLGLARPKATTPEPAPQKVFVVNPDASEEPLSKAPNKKP